MSLFTPATRCLIAVAEAGSIRKAADRLNLSPSSINRLIKQLEWELNTALFDRLPNGLRLNEAGRLLFEEIKTAEQRLDRVQKDIEGLKGLNKGHISIGVVDCFSRQFLPDVLTGLRRDIPGITLDIHVERTGVLADKLLSGAIDLALGFNMPPFPEFQVLTEYQIPVGVVFAPGHRLAANKNAPALADCLKHDLLLPEKSFGLNQTLTFLAAGLGTRLHPAITANSVESLKTMVRDSAGISFLTALDVYDEVTRGLLRFHPLAVEGTLTEPLSLCIRSQKAKQADTPVIAPLISREIRRIEEMMFEYTQQPVLK